MNIDDILFPGERRRPEIAQLDWQILFLNHALEALKLNPPAATDGNDLMVPGRPEGQNNLTGTAGEVCADCKGTGIRDHDVDGCDCEVACWCQAGDKFDGGDL